MQGHHGHLSAEQKQLAFRLRRRGWRLTAIAREIGCTAPMVGLMVSSGKHLGAAPFGWEPRSGCLTIQEREQILLGIGRGDSLSEIARSLALPVHRDQGGECERWSRALLSLACTRSSSSTGSPAQALQTAAGQVAAGSLERLEQLWSPEEIARRLPLEYPDDPEMRVSHETIYQSLFVQGRGELRRELARCLRSGELFGVAGVVSKSGADFLAW